MFKPRINGGRRLEPTGDVILHGAGQDPEAFATYSELCKPTRPMIYMAYTSVRGRTPGFLTQWTEQHPDDDQRYLIPQIGLCMTSDGRPEKHYEQDVAAGDYDEQIEIICDEFEQHNRPVFLRIGYEFNGGWNGYQPDSYRAAFQRIAGRIRDRGLDHVACCWCAEAGARTPEGTNWWDYYPGDDFVDWWSIDLFSPGHFSNAEALEFMQESVVRKFPVIIGESTPRRVGVQDGKLSWERWFAIYWQALQQWPSFKAFSYINWNWAGYPMWSDWGDGRLEMNQEVLDRWLDQLSAPIVAHGRDGQATRELLGLS